MKTLSISIKTAIICSTIVSLVLLGTSVFFINSQSQLVHQILDEYILKINQVIDQQGNNQKQALEQNFAVNANILSSISGQFIYDFDSERLTVLLLSFMNFPGIEAIQVWDEDDAPFAAVWKEDQIQSGEAIPESFVETLSHEIEVFHEEGRVGRLKVFFSDAALMQFLEASKSNTQQDIQQFESLVDQDLSDAQIMQYGAIIVINIILIGTLVFTLRIVVIGPIIRSSQFAETVADGDFSSKLEITRRDEIGVLVTSLNDMIQALSKTFHQINELSEKLDNDSVQLTELSQNVFYSVDQQTQYLQEISASIRDLVERTNANTEHAENTFQLGVSAKEYAEEGSSKMNQMMEAIEKINQSTSDISQIIKAINEIAFQTNMLAINAAVESARAGASGKGFAIVAQEVRNLAQRTAAEAGKTSKIIEGTTERIQSGVHIAGETAEVLGSIVTSSNDVTNLVQKIVEANNLQKNEIEKVNRAIQQLLQSIENHKEQSVQGMNASKELSKITTLLGQLLAHFKLTPPE